MSELKQPIALIKSGDKEQARPILASILKADGQNEQAWLWLSACFDSDVQRRHCLENVLRINPNSELAQHGLALLAQKQPPARPKLKPLKSHSRLPAVTKEQPPKEESLPKAVDQGPSLNKPKRQSVGRTIYHIFAFVVIAGFLGCVGLSILGNLDTIFSPYGEKLVYNGGEVYYSSRVHKDVAEDVGIFLMEIGYFSPSRQNDPVAVQIDYAEEQFQVKFIFVPGVEKDEGSNAYWFATTMGRCLAGDVFGEPIAFHFADSTFNTLKVEELEPTDWACRRIRGY
ncbi:MAG: hypothetical protein KDJ97_35155 [Anaerolineae bacterium]|nr:hypothetical protein [Anaerolineae bacterium]